MLTQEEDIDAHALPDEDSMEYVPLTSAQSVALGYVATCRPGLAIRLRALAHLQRWQIGVPATAKPNPGLLTINFHPDRPFRQTETILDSILRSGRIQNQFESGVTNGFALGSKEDVRARRESVLFGGAYDQTAVEERPKYGAVNLFSNPRGGWPRFGSCYWVLDPELLPRCSVTIPQSTSSTAWWGTHDDLGSLIAGLPEAERPLDAHRYRFIDGPVELQVHGEILLERDVTALIVDPSFAGSSIETTARLVARAFNLSLGWAPPLYSTGAQWRVPTNRRLARQRVRSALDAGEPITAAWIGQDSWIAQAGSPPSGAVVNGAGRYLWNRLLLSQDQ